MKRKETRVYYVELYGGYCGLRAAKSLPEARKEAIEDQGRSNVSLVRAATENDVIHVRAMGGYVPEGRVRKSEKS